MPGGPHAAFALGTDDDAHALRCICLIDGRDQLATHLFAQTIEMLRILHRDKSDAVVNSQIYNLFTHIFVGLRVQSYYIFLIYARKFPIIC